MRRIDQPNIGIITFPINDAGVIPLSNLVDILRPLFGQVHLITGNAGYAFFKENRQIHTYEVRHEKRANTFTKVINYILTQFKISVRLMKIVGNIEFFIFFIGQDLLIPIVTAKLLGKKVVLSLAGSSLETRRAQKDIFSAHMLKFLEQINYILSDMIILYSDRLIGEYGLEKHKGKVSIARTHFLNFNEFKICKRLCERDDLTGYIGRLSEEKGVLNFVRAIPKILKKKGEIQFLIVGNGQLCDRIVEYINEKRLNDKVKVLEWIPHDEIPTYLDRLKLLVLPSYTEGLPNIMLEAMASGTPVLATAVGGIPDIVRNGHTGLLIKENSPQCIAENVIMALSHPNLEHIVKNARVLVEREFTYEAAVEQYKRVLNLVLRAR